MRTTAYIACVFGMLTCPVLAQNAPVAAPPAPKLIINCGGDWKDGQVQEPCILVNPKDASKLIMFYAGMKHGGREGAIAKAWANVSDPFTWQEDTEHPLLQSEAGTGFDSLYVRLDSVIYNEATDEYWIYYTGNSTKTHTDAIGLATCPTGKDGYSEVVAANMKRYAGNPILSPKGDGRDDETYVSQGAVLRENGLWYLFYSYRTASKTLPGIRLATSRDGKQWTKIAGPDLLRASPKSRYCEWHQVCKIGDVYVLLFEGYNGGIRWCADIATSSSLTTGWQKMPQPLVDQRQWPNYSDALFHVATPAIYNINNHWYLYFCAAHSDGDYNWQHWDMWCAECDAALQSCLESREPTTPAENGRQ
jgi:hypothetical protein